MQKKIILINESGLNEIFTEAFRKEGYDVISILEDSFLYKKNIWTKLMNIYYRVVLKKNNFYGEDYYNKLNKEVYKRLKKIEIEEVDYTLIFRADYYSSNNIKLLREKSKMLVSYQYDGWELGKGIINHKDYLDRVYFFDKDDISKFGEKSLPLTNCYFQNNEEISLVDFDLFYLGTGTKDRIKNLKNIYNRLDGKYKIKGLVTIPKYQKENKWGDVQFSHKGVSYKENIVLLKTAKCLIDIKFTYHNGLSFRFFEALHYKKKLITNNESVKKYDFYNPDNIFITNFEDLDGVEEFLEKPYVEVDKNIVDKYGFKNWSRYVLDRPPYNNIELP